MQKYIECTGKTEDAAIAAALDQLGLAREEVSVEVLELAKPGFLGIGGTLAKVRVSYEAPEEETAAPVLEEAPAAAPVEEAAEEAEEYAAPAVREPAVGKTPANDDVSARITAFLSGLLAQMEVNAAPQVSLDEEGNYLVELVGQELGCVIGRRGETLDAIQQLTGYAVNRDLSHRVRIRIDAEGYRSKREESLERMARRTAEKAVRFRRNVTLEPMNAYERHVIHTALQDYPDVTTYSIGTEPNRRTVVAYTPGEGR